MAFTIGFCDSPNFESAILHSTVGATSRFHSLTGLPRSGEVIQPEAATCASLRLLMRGTTVSYMDKSVILVTIRVPAIATAL
jgi:hypothetical protein